MKKGVSLIMNYRYPENLAAKPILWLWYLRDIGIIGIGAVISVLIISQTAFFLPLIFVGVYAFLSIRTAETSILDFIKYACSYFVFKQQYYHWYISKKEIKKQDAKKGKTHEKK